MIGHKEKQRMCGLQLFLLKLDFWYWVSLKVVVFLDKVLKNAQHNLTN